MIYSYDIFDTCLVRKCGKQEFVFEILAKTVLGPYADESQCYDFVLARKSAEDIARKRSNREDIRLKDIYDNFDMFSFTKVDNSIVMEKELEIQDSMLTPVYLVKQEIDRLHENGHSVVFISDMYLPTDFLKSILVRHGLFQSGDSIYVSGDVGYTKASGSLYNYIKDEKNVDFKEWIHKGDNSYSDYKKPMSLGIRAKMISNPYSYYELKMIKADSSGSRLDVQKAAACARAVRLSFSDTPVVVFAADFIAPIYTTFVFFILQDARKRKIKNLFFMARDGYILYVIAQKLQFLFPDVGLHYFYASRTSLYLPGLNAVSVNSLVEAFPAMSEDVGELLSILGLSVTINQEEYRMLSVEKKVEKLLENTEIYKAIKEKYEEQRSLCIRYFKQIGLTQPNSAIVDVFGSRKSERCVNTILRRDGYDSIFMYYYGVMWARVLDDSRYLAMFYNDRMRHSVNDTYYTQKQSLFEQYFSITPQKRTIGYKKDGNIVKPVFEEDLLTDEYKQRVFETNKMVCQKYAECYSLLYIADHRQCCEVSQSVFNYFFHIPRKEYLSALCDFSQSDNGKSEKLLYKCNLFKVIMNKSKSNEWFHGQLVYNSGILYKPVILFLKWLWKIRIMKVISI